MAIMPVEIGGTYVIFFASHANIMGFIPFSNVIGSLAVEIPNALGLSNDLCADSFVRILKNGLTTIIEVLTALGVVVAVIGIIVGGLMRATSWGNDQRVATSNKAITSAIIGLVIVLIAVALGNAVPSWFGLQNNTCILSPSAGPTSTSRPTTSIQQNAEGVSNQQLAWTGSTNGEESTG
jgi:hypothetical protein